MNKTAQVLRFIAAKSVVSLSDVSNSRQLESFFIGSSTTAQRRIIDTCALLAKQGYITVGHLDGEKIFKITHKGQRRLDRSQLLSNTIDSSRWDGRWYFVTFDLPESKKTTRNQIILNLKRNGFLNYTKGLWLLPYNPIKLVEGLRQEFSLNKELRLIVASHVDDEKALIKHFRLTKTPH